MLEECKFLQAYLEVEEFGIKSSRMACSIKDLIVISPLLKATHVTLQTLEFGIDL